MVYGKSVTDALTTAGYSFDDFMAAVQSEAQGVLANEKIPEVEVYLVNDANQEYKLEPSDGGDASWINSLKLEASGALGWLEYVLDWLTDLYDWMLGDTSTVGEIYKIYRVDNVPQGDYTLEIRGVGGDGYTVQIPDSGKTRVHVGDEDMNYVGVDEHLGQHTLEVAGLEIWDIHFYAPGIYLDTVEPGLAFTSADLGGHPLPGTEFMMINRDEAANKVAKASESVVTCELTTDWKFYTATTSIRTNLALQVQSIIRGLADSVDASGQSVIAATAKEILNGMADNIDTTNRIIEETTAIQEEIQEAVSNVVSNVVNAAVKAVTGIGKWLVKMGTKP